MSVSWRSIAAAVTLVLTSRVVAAAAPDLVPTVLTVPSSGNAATGIPVSWTVENQGDAAVSGNWVDRFYFSTDAVFDGSDTFLANGPEAARSRPARATPATARSTCPTWRLATTTSS